MVGLKPFETLLHVHPSAAVQGLGLAHSYQLAQDCSLPEQAPEEIRELWARAQHLLAYSSLEYSFVVVADTVGAAVVEAALRKECAPRIEAEKAAGFKEGKKPRDVKFAEVLKMFREKLSDALGQEELDFFFDRLEAFRKVRNSFTHPERVSLYPPTRALMIRTSEWLGAYYKGELKQMVRAWMEYSDKENRRIKAVFEEIRRQEQDSKTGVE